MKKGDEKKEAKDKKKRPYTPPRPENEKKKNEIKKRKDRERKPFIQVDKSGDVISNFLSNFLKQFKNPTTSGLGKLLGKLLVVKIKENEKEPLKPSDIMGPVKTVFNFRKIESVQDATLDQKRPVSLSIHQSNNIRQVQGAKQEEIKPRKPRMGM